MAERVPVYLAAQVRAAEKPLLDAGEPLMRRAAGALARDRARRTGGARRPRARARGQRGQRGRRAVRRRAARRAEGVAVDVLRTSDRVHEAALDAAVRGRRARRWRRSDALGAASGYDLVLDGILGIGASPSAALRGAARTVVEALLPAVRGGRPRVIAVDVPSGLRTRRRVERRCACSPPPSPSPSAARRRACSRGADPSSPDGSCSSTSGCGPACAGVHPSAKASVAAVVRDRRVGRARGSTGATPARPARTAARGRSRHAGAGARRR